MLGDIIARLTDEATAEEAADAVARPEILLRMRDDASSAGRPLGQLVAEKVRRVVDGGGEDVWLDLIGVMSGSDQPGAAAMERLLAYAFPDPVRVRIKRGG